jgi:hypothetical protein
MLNLLEAGDNKSPLSTQVRLTIVRPIKKPQETTCRVPCADPILHLNRGLPSGGQNCFQLSLPMRCNCAPENWDHWRSFPMSAIRRRIVATIDNPEGSCDSDESVCRIVEICARAARISSLSRTSSYDSFPITVN